MAHRSRFSSQRERGQIAILTLLIISIFVILGIGGIDVYRIYEIRSWAAQAAQRAASQGVTTAARLSEGERLTGVDLYPCAGYITLDQSLAVDNATVIMESYLLSRIAEFSAAPSLYVYALNTPGNFIVFPDAPSRGFANNPASGRLYLGATQVWEVDEPSVAVAGVIPVSTFLGSFVGMSTIDVTYFATAAVSQPDNVCAAP